MKDQDQGLPGTPGQEEPDAIRLQRQLANATKKARDWNAEADRYLAQRDELLSVLKRWVGDGALQTYEDRERFRAAARAAIAKAGGPVDVDS